MKAYCPAIQIARYVQRRAAAGTGINHHVFQFGIALQQVPDEIARRRALVAGDALLLGAVALFCLLAVTMIVGICSFSFCHMDLSGLGVP